MRREIITQSQIVTLTQEVVHGFYDRSIEHLTHYLHDDFIWIGAFAFQFVTSKQAFLDMIQSELHSIPFTVDDEHYHIISRDKDSWVLCCSYRLNGILPDQSQLQTYTRMTIMWKYCNGAPKIIHVHGSNAQDIPLTVTEKLERASGCPQNFVTHLQSTAAFDTPAPLLFRGVDGKHHAIHWFDILYLKANRQSTIVATGDGCITVSGILKSHEAKLPASFYRIHKSYIINLTHLQSYCRYEATLMKGATLPISKERYMALKHHLQSHQPSANDNG